MKSDYHAREYVEALDLGELIEFSNDYCGTIYDLNDYLDDDYPDALDMIATNLIEALTK